MPIIEIWHSPTRPSVEMAFGVALKAHVPYSDNSVTIQVAPNIQGYDENADTDSAQVRQVTVSTTSDQTQELAFALEGQRVHEVEADNRKLSIELLSIEKGKGGDPGWCFEFNVSDLTEENNNAED